MNMSCLPTYPSAWREQHPECTFLFYQYTREKYLSQAKLSQVRTSQDNTCSIQWIKAATKLNACTIFSFRQPLWDPLSRSKLPELASTVPTRIPQLFHLPMKKKICCLDSSLSSYIHVFCITTQRANHLHLFSKTKHTHTHTNTPKKSSFARSWAISWYVGGFFRYSHGRFV